MNIAELIKKYCQKGDELYSPIFGTMKYKGIIDSLNKIVVENVDNIESTFGFDGKKFEEGECCLFPSKEQRDWSIWAREQEQKKYMDIHVGDYVTDRRVWGKVVDVKVNGDLIVLINCSHECGCGYYWTQTHLVEKLNHFDHKLLKPFDKVLVKNMKNGFYGKWRIAHFDSINPQGGYFVESGACVDFCVPFNPETKSIHGTLENAPEFYR